MATTNKPLLQRQTVTAMVAEYIAGLIIAGDYPGGHQIRQEAIAAELGVSRIPVREALLQLEADGLVVIRTHRGAVVAELSSDDAIDLFDARIQLEPFLAEKAIARASEDDIATVETSMRAYEVAISRGESPKELSRLNWAFHTALLEPAMRPRSMAVVRTLYSSADRYLRLQIEPAKAQAKALREHRDLFDAYRRKDGAQTAGLLRKHIADAADEIVSQLRKSEAVA
ncbi:MAG: GntR family transcriptional regulator [Mesorhizobium sp.]